MKIFTTKYVADLLRSTFLITFVSIIITEHFNAFASAVKDNLFFLEYLTFGFIKPSG